MTNANDSSIKKTQIYVALLNEGVSVVRPAEAEILGNNLYRILPTKNYTSDNEEWEFPPGAIVRCKHEMWSGDNILVAKHLATK